MNDDELLLLLMQTIRVNGNTFYLLEHGYTLSRLTKDIDSMKERGFVRNVEEKLVLTEKGEAFFNKKNKEMGRKGLYKYISLMFSLKDAPIPLNAIYVPPKRGKGKKK